MNELKGSGQTPGFEKPTVITLSAPQLRALRGSLFHNSPFTTEGTPVSVLKRRPDQAYLPDSSDIIASFRTDAGIKTPTLVERIAPYATRIAAGLAVATGVASALDGTFNPTVVHATSLDNTLVDNGDSVTNLQSVNSQNPVLEPLSATALEIDQRPTDIFAELTNAIPNPEIIGAFDGEPEYSAETGEWLQKTTKGVFIKTNNNVLTFTENGIPDQRTVHVIELNEQGLSEQDHARVRKENEQFAFEVANSPTYYAQSVDKKPVNDGGGEIKKPSEKFQLGFKLLAGGMLEQGFDPGEPLEDEHFEPSTGNSLQKTTKGLMVWRKADNWTAFTDGERTWINGPFGVMSRTNNERFNWEKDQTAVLAETPQLKQIQIIDNEAGPAFTEHVQAALDLLKQKDPEHYQLVASAGIIRFLKGRGSRAGVDTQKEPYSILLGETAIEENLILLAAQLGHEATHIVQERKYFAEHPGATFSAPGTAVGLQADGEALKAQAEICERLGDSYSAAYYRVSIGIYDGSTASIQKALEAFQALQGGK